MALIIKDRVKEITTTTGTGAVSLGGSSATFDAFQSVMSNGDTTFYAIVHTASGTDEWEVGLGTWNTGNTLTRTTVYAGSNGASAVNFSSGNKDIFMTYPASKAAVAGEDVTFADITATDITATGTVTLSGDPTSALQAATKEYVDTIAAAGIHYHTPVRVESPDSAGNLNATYDNGSSGVGATLTNAGTQAALVIDGVTLNTNDRVLIYSQTNGYENGIYTVTNTGSASTNWVLTRATDADSYGASDQDALGEGDAFFVKEGDTGAGELYVMNTSGVITFGTTNISFTVVAETAVYSAGTGLTLTGTTFSTNQDISTSASPTFAGGTFTGNVDFGDNDAIRLGAGNDLQIYHDGSNSYINEVGTGSIFLRTDGNAVIMTNSTGTKVSGRFFPDSLADLWYNGSQKFKTENTGVRVYGNIVVSGTVDGRDVATDGSKLDGIESGATADQTAAEILTAIKTVDGVGSNLDADLLDGQQGSYYLNTSTTFSGDVSGTYNNIVVTNDSHTHDGRYYTETEADSRFVNVTGDTMTGGLTISSGSDLVLSTSGTDIGDIVWSDSSGEKHRLWDGGTGLNYRYRAGTSYLVFHDGYHPNADKWTTARTLSLSGDASGSVSWDGSANATLSVTVANDSHTHTNTTLDMHFGRETQNIDSYDSDSYWATSKGTGGQGSYPSNYVNVYNFAGNGSSEGTQLATYYGSNNRTWIRSRNDNNNSWLGWSEVWTSTTDGSGSGLDADLLDGIQGSSFLRSDAADTASGDITFTGGAGAISVGAGSDLRFTTGNWTGEYTGKIQYHSGHFYFQSADQWILRNSSAVNVMYGDQSGNWTAVASLRSPLYYDSNNTAYYVDPSSTSNIYNLQTANQVVIGGTFSNNNYDSVSSTRLTFGGAAQINDYFIGTNLNNYGGNYTKLDLRLHTGIRMGAQQQYGGVRIFDSEDVGTRLFSVGEGDTNVRVTNTLYAANFYDINNTAYYVDPASTSLLNALEFGDSAGPTLSQERDQNLKLQGGSGGDVGITGYGGDGSWDFQLYGSGGQQGFLRSNWGSWSAYADTSGNWTGTASVRAPIFYDSNNTAYYVNPASTSYINEIWAGAPDGNSTAPRYDTSFYVVQSQHWYGHSGSQGMYLGESGNDVYVRGQMAIGGTAIQSSYALTMSGSIDMNAQNIDYVGQLHFQDNVRFYDDGNDNYLNFKWGDTGAGGIRLYDGDNSQQGYLYGSGDGRIGLLSADGTWGIEINNSKSNILHRLDTPIMYDLDNTAYYVNSASTSLLNVLELAGDLDFRNQTGTWIRSDQMTDSIGWNNSYGVYIGSDIGGTTYIYGSGYFYDGSAYQSLIHTGNVANYAAGATGGGSDEIFWENDQTVTTNYTITNGQNAMSAGPITINSGVTVTIGTGEAWTVV